MVRVERKKISLARARMRKRKWTRKTRKRERGSWEIREEGEDREGRKKEEGERRKKFPPLPYAPA